jgi:histidine ammonia-lyase
MLLLLAASLARGHSAVRPVIVENLLALLNAGVTPLIPATGSVGASGDLAPLAHLALAMIGEGEIFAGGEPAPSAEVLREAGHVGALPSKISY